MQGPPFQKDIRLPYSKWSQHRADNGLIYLAHPITGEVKWLWSRHHDPKTDHDYLVNTVTGKRQWVTKENAHFCPVKHNAQAKNAANSKVKTSTSAQNPSLVNATEQKSESLNPPVVSAINHFVKMPTAPANIATASRLNYREIPAPKSLGLTADEVLMLVPDTGRRYVFNKKTKASRWLPDRPTDTIANEKRQRSLFGRSKLPKQPPSQLKDDDGIHPHLNMKNRPPSMGAVDIESHSGNGVAEYPASDNTIMKRVQDQPAANSHRDTQASLHVEECQTPKPATNNDVKSDVNEVSSRLGALNTILEDVIKLTTSDKYNMAKLRSLSTETPSKEQAQVGTRRLLELEEYLTQQMLKVDAVESEGNQVIRAKRKETVKAILALTEEIERLREELSS